MRYLLNSAVITTAGKYSYRLISVEEAKEWLSQGDYMSTIGYPETAKALEVLTGFKCEVNRGLISMKDGDEALVFRLTKRLEDPSKKGRLTPQEVIESCEIGILRKETN